MNDSFPHSDMVKELPAFSTVCQKRDNQIRQQRAEKAAQNLGGTCFASSPKLPAPPKDAAAAPAGSVGRHTGPAPMDLSAGRRRISVEEWARGLRMGGFYTVVGLTTGRQNARQGKRLRHSRWLEQR